MSSFDLNIGSTNIDFEDVGDWSETELTEFIEEAIKDMSTQECEAFLEKLPEELEKLEESGYEDLNDLEAELHALKMEYGDDPDNYLQTRKQREIDELQLTIDQVEIFFGCAEEASEVVERNNQLNPSSFDSSESWIENGQEITFTFNSDGSPHLFDDGEEASGIPVYDNTFHLNLNSDTLQLVSVGENERTFKITRKDGIVFYAKLIGNANFVCNGSNYIDPNVLDTWPDETLKMFYDGEQSANKNYYNRVYGFDSKEVAKSIPVSNDFLGNTNSEFEVLDNLLTESTIYSRMEEVDGGAYCRDPLTTEEKNLIEEIMLKLFGSEINLEGGPTMASVWEEIIALVGDLSMDSQNKIYTSIAYLTSKYDGANLPFYAPTLYAENMTQAMRYYDYVADEDSQDVNNTSLDAFSKMGIICFLEFYPDAGIVDGNLNTFLADNSNNIENAKALECVKGFISVEQEIVNENANAEMNPNMKVSEELNNNLCNTNNMRILFRDFFDHETLTATEDAFDKYFDNFQDLIAAIYDPATGSYDTGYMSANAMRNKIKNHLSNIENKTTQTLMSNMFFMMMGNEKYGGDPAFLETLCLDTDWVRSITSSCMSYDQFTDYISVSGYFNAAKRFKVDDLLIPTLDFLEEFTGLKLT